MENGEMVFQCVKDDGSADMYTLGLSISRHQKTNLQIDSITFKNFRVSETGDGRKIDMKQRKNRGKSGMRKEIYKEWQSIFPALFVHEDSQWELQIYVQGRYAHRWRTDYG